MLNEYNFSKAEKINMKTTDKVQVGDSTTGTSTSTTWHCPYTQPRAEQGWECPRCGRINAPWVRQCDCSRSYDKWDITWNKDDYTKPWWQDYKVTCAPETICEAPSSICCSDSATRQPNVTAWNCTNPNNCHTPHYTTETVVNDGIHNFYNLRISKETK